VVGIDRNRWSPSTEIGGRHQTEIGGRHGPKSVVGFAEIRTDRLMEEPEAFVEPVEDSLLNGLPNEEIKNKDLRRFLPESIDAADTLLQAHWVPRQIVIDDNICALEVEALTADLAA
jgi:hypothetical protein